MRLLNFFIIGFEFLICKVILAVLAVISLCSAPILAYWSFTDGNVVIGYSIVMVYFVGFCVLLGYILEEITP